MRPGWDHLAGGFVYLAQKTSISMILKAVLALGIWWGSLLEDEAMWQYRTMSCLAS